MKRSRFSEEEIIGVLKEAEATTVKATCAKRNISEATYYGWREKYGGMDVNEERGLRALEGGNGGLKRVGAGPLHEERRLQRVESKKCVGPLNAARHERSFLRQAW